MRRDWVLVLLGVLLVIGIHLPVRGRLSQVLHQPVRSDDGTGAGGAVPEGAFLLLETGDYLLLENSKIMLSGAGIADQPIIDGPDDGDYDDGGGFDNTAVDIDLGNDVGTAKKGFFYFPETGIPQGSEIVTAYLQVTSAANLSDVTVNLKLIGSDEDDAAVPANKNDAAGRPRTTAQTLWNNVEAWTADTVYDSPSIKNILQEVVDRSGFSGAFLLFVEDNGSTVASKRKVHSYNGDPAKAAELVVTYWPATPPAPPSPPAPSYSWLHTMTTVGENGIVRDDKFYGCHADIAASGNGGLVIYDALTGTILQYNNIGSFGIAPAIDTSGYIHCHLHATGDLIKIEEGGGVSDTLAGLAIGIEWEALVYDGVNDQLFIPVGGELRAVDASDYSTNWTTAGVNLAAGAGRQTSPPLIVGNYVYIIDRDCVVWKIDLSDGSLDDSLDISANTYDSYFALIYDQDNDLIYACDGSEGNNSATVTAIDPGTMGADWTKTVEAVGYEMFRAGAYHDDILYVTTRETSSPYRSKVYALDVTNLGNILWTNTTAFDNDGSVTSVVVDDDYLYAAIHDYSERGGYGRIMGLDLSDGSVVFNWDLTDRGCACNSGTSSSVASVWGGKFMIGLWDSCGFIFMRLREDGGTGDSEWKGDSYHTGYFGSHASGAIVGN